MKHFYFFAFLLSGFLVTAQQQVLLQTQWQLNNIILGNTSYTPPINQEVNPTSLQFLGPEDNYSFMANVCNTMFGNCTAVDDTSFTLSPQVYVTLILCNQTENAAFEGLYFSFFNEVSVAPVTFQYSIGYLGDYPFLIVTAPNGDQATYGAYLAGTDSFVKQGFTVTPNPASSYVDIALNGPGSGELTIYDLTGRKCQAQQVSATEHVDVSRLSAGCYLFSVTTPAGTTTEKVIIR